MIGLVVLLLGAAVGVVGASLVIRATGHRPHPWSDRTTRRLAWAALAWTVLAGMALLVAPTTSTASSTVSVSSSESTPSADSPREVETTTSSGTLLEREGVGVVAVLLVPVAVALLGALGDGPAARRRRLTAGWALAGACVVGAASLGLFFAPAALALLAAGFMTRRRPVAPGGRAVGSSPGSAG